MEEKDKLTWAFIGFGILTQAIEEKGYEIQFVKMEKGGEKK